MKRFASVLVLAAIAVVAFQYLFGWDEWISRLESWVRATGNPWIFVFAMGVGCAFALPLSFTYLYAGMAFGTLAGWSLSLAGLFISGTVGFIMGRYVLDDVSAEKFRAKAKINSKKNLYNLNFYVRAIPGIPYWMQNIILGSVHTDFKMYTLSNMSVQGAIALAMNYLGASIGADNSAKYWAFGILIAVLVAVNRILAKYCIH